MENSKSLCFCNLQGLSSDKFRAWGDRIIALNGKEMRGESSSGVWA